METEGASWARKQGMRVSQAPLGLVTPNGIWKVGPNFSAFALWVWAFQELQQFCCCCC